MSSTVLVYFEEVGLVHYPADLDPANPGADYGNVLARVGSQLDEIARSLSVLPLSDFHYADPDMLRSILGELEGKGRANIERLLATQQEWHDVEEGRRTTAALLSWLEQLDLATAAAQHPKLLLGRTLEPLLADLRALDYVLASNDSRFHLEAM